MLGRIQHGEQQIKGKTKKVVDYGYFIAKVKDNNLNFLINRFNEKYPQKNVLHIRFFDEEPLSIRRIRYNLGGALCYCMYNQTQGKHKEGNVWKPVNCSENCKYRIAEEGKQKPLCNFEGTLKFLLPEISQDRIWLMKITGQTSIFRLKEYIEFQKYLGNSLIGDYYIFLKKENQTNKLGKSYNNFILDIIRKEDTNFEVNNSSNPIEKSTVIPQNVDNSTEKSNIEEYKTEKSVNTPIKRKTAKKQVKETIEPKADIINIENVNKKDNSKEEKNNFDNYYLLLETFTKKFKKEGKPKDYLLARFVDQYDNVVEAIIPPNFKDELSECGTGTTVILDLKTIGEKTITNNIEFVQKMPKDVAA